MPATSVGQEEVRRRPAAHRAAPSRAAPPSGRRATISASASSRCMMRSPRWGSSRKAETAEAPLTAPQKARVSGRARTARSVRSAARGGQQPPSGTVARPWPPPPSRCPRASTPPSAGAWQRSCPRRAPGRSRRRPPSCSLDADLREAFGHLARLEEAAPDAPADEHGRFPAAASSLGPRDAPLDELVLEVRARLVELGLEPAGYPGGARFAVALTHDIDTPWRWTRLGLRGAAARGKAALARASRPRRRARRPGWRSRRCTGCAAPIRTGATAPFGASERARGFRSTSYVIAAHRDPHDGAAPEAYDRRRGQLVRELLQQGDEVGLHASYTAGDDPEALRDERDALAAVAGGRSRATASTTCACAGTRPSGRSTRSGFEHDSTLGWSGRPGRARVSRSPFGPGTSRRAAAEIVEVPLLLMDATLAEERYLGLSAEEAWPRSSACSTSSPPSGVRRGALAQRSLRPRLRPRLGRALRAPAGRRRGARRHGRAGGELAAWWRAERCAS